MAFEDEADVLYKFEYHLQDHLGNTRVVFGGHSNGKAELVQQTDYYPFGLVMAQREYLSYDDFPENQVLANKYLYNGKEWQDEEIGGAKLNWYDYGARFYDPELGRWHLPDPMAEVSFWWSSYKYGYDNPIRFVDPDGMLESGTVETGDEYFATKYIDERGKELLNTDDGSDAVVVVTDEKRKEFEASVKKTKNKDDPTWNNNIKKFLLGFELTEEQENLISMQSSDWSRKNLIEYWKDQNLNSWIEYLVAEVLSQNANPINHLPTPLNVRTKPRIKTTIKIKSTNPWHLFRTEMGKGKFTKERYGSKQAAAKARQKAYKEWKRKNGYN